MLVSSHTVARCPGPLEDLGYHDCGALGPTIVDTDTNTWIVLTCRRLDGHSGPHGNHAGDHSRGWRRPYLPITLEGAEISIKPPDARGRIPRGTLDHQLLQHALRDHVHRHLEATDQLTLDEPAWDPRVFAETRQWAKQRLKATNGQAADQDVDVDVVLQHLAEHTDRADTLVDRLRRQDVDVELCAHVDPDQLAKDQHRAAWLRDGLLHVCQEPAGHRQNVPRGRQGHRCVCHPGCDTRRSAAVYGPLPPTTRPDHQLPLEEART